MARPKSDFLKSWGTMFEILKALVNEVLERGGTDDDMRRIQTDLALRAQIAQLIVKSGKKSKQKPATFELYLHPEQAIGGWIGGQELEAHLEETGRIKRALSSESPEVKGWIADPPSYPEEFKEKSVLLWGSRRDSGDLRFIAYLVWFDGKVLIRWDLLKIGWNHNDPALLASVVQQS